MRRSPGGMRHGGLMMASCYMIGRLTAPDLEWIPMKLKIVAFGFIAALAGCTTAGPYVTNISSDGRNGLNIEKCAVKLNAFMGTVSTTECTSQNVRLSRAD